MQYFSRQNVPPPAVFYGPAAGENRQALKALFDFDQEKLSQSFAPRTFLSLDEPEVRSSLERLFHEKCAFCERKTTTRPFRFRPMTEASPTKLSDPNSHLYYAWLADAWQNIYPICDRCEPREGINHFPVRGNRCRLPTFSQLEQFVEEGTGLWPQHPPVETAYLFDPCDRKDYWSQFQMETRGLIFGKTPAADETVRHFGLNREDLVQHRYERFHDYLSRLEAYVRYSGQIGLESVVDFAEMEFGGTWYLLLRQICTAIGFDGGRAQPLTMARIGSFLEKLKNRQDGALRLSAAMAVVDQAAQVGVSAEFVGPSGRSGKLRLQKVTLHDFKALESLELDMPPQTQQLDDRSMLAPSLLILGENAAGKSSILEAVALALMTDEARRRLAPTAVNFILNPAFMGAPEQAARSAAVVDLTFDDGSSHRMSIDQNGFSHRSRIDQYALPPVFAYGAFRRYLRDEKKYTADKYVSNLMRSEGVLSNPEKWLLRLDDAVFAMVVRQLRHVLSIEGEFEVIRRNKAEKRCYIVTAIPGSPEGRQSLTPLEVASSGFRTVLATVCDIFQGLLDPRVSGSIETLSQARAVVLIDEIETHLHPRWKMGVMRGLRQALPNVTFIATTHDPLCLRGMGDHEVMVLQRTGRDATAQRRPDGQLPVFVERLVKLPPTSHLTVEQLLTSDFFQLYSADAPEIEGKLATVGDLLAKRRRGDVLTLEEEKTLKSFDEDIESALPVGLSEAHRLVQEVVAEFLRERRVASDDRLRSLRKETKEAILRILKGVAG